MSSPLRLSDAELDARLLGRAAFAGGTERPVFCKLLLSPGSGALPAPPGFLSSRLPPPHRAPNTTTLTIKFSVRRANERFHYQRDQ
jgi:hypothetical protein